MGDLSQDFKPHTVEKKPLTVAQKRTLEGMRQGMVLARHFDAYAGYWWTLKGGGPEIVVRRATVQALRDTGQIDEGETTRPYSGRHYTPYRLVEAA
jgi:hypothetical protein